MSAENFMHAFDKESIKPEQPRIFIGDSIWTLIWLQIRHVAEELPTNQPLQRPAHGVLACSYQRIYVCSLNGDTDL
jgi:hypothetical protein